MKLPRKLLLISPYLLVTGITINTWIQFIRGNYIPQWQHWAALVLVVLNGVLYMRSIKRGFLFTGIILILATINLLAFFPAISWMFWGSGGSNNAIYNLGIQPSSLLFFIIYTVANGNYLADLYVNRKEARANKKSSSNQ